MSIGESMQQKAEQFRSRYHAVRDQTVAWEPIVASWRGLG